MNLIGLSARIPLAIAVSNGYNLRSLRLVMEDVDSKTPRTVERSHLRLEDSMLWSADTLTQLSQQCPNLDSLGFDSILDTMPSIRSLLRGLTHFRKLTEVDICSHNPHGSGLTNVRAHDLFTAFNRNKQGYVLRTMRLLNVCLINYGTWIISELGDYVQLGITALDHQGVGTQHHREGHTFKEVWLRDKLVCQWIRDSCPCTADADCRYGAHWASEFDLDVRRRDVVRWVATF